MWTIWMVTQGFAQDGAPWVEMKAGERYRPTDEVLAALGAPIRATSRPSSSGVPS